MRPIWWIPIAIFIFQFSLLEAQEPFHPQKLTGALSIDGVIDETAWEEIKPLDIVMNSPEFGKPPTQQTEIKLAYDDDFIYLAGKMYDTEPDKIQAPSKKRDELSLSNDWFGIIIDSYNDNENGVAFFTTPSGLRLDMTVFNDGQGDFPISQSWNTFWDVRTTRDEKGWYAEMKIPFSSLRFQDENGNVVMGIITWRWIARNNEIDVFPAIEPNWGFWSVFKASQAQDALFQNVYSKKPLYIAPYVLGGVQQNFNLNENETEYIKEVKPDFEAGLDLKYSLTSNITMDLTVNTDFAQVEADNQQVNLTRFSLFFPEKRLFFLERESLFDFNLGGSNKLFHSRTIGIHDGDPVRIYGGVRLNGRTNGWDLGLINMQTASIDEQNSENFGVLRVRKQLFNKYSYLGAMLTNRMDFKGAFNTVYGIDGVMKMGADHYLTARWAHSFDDEIDSNTIHDPTKLFVFLEKRSYKGLNYVASLTRSGEDYFPEMGFEHRSNYIRYGGTANYGWTDIPASKLLRYSFGLDGFALRSFEKAHWESAELRAITDLSFKSGYYAYVSPGWQFEDVPDTFDLDNDTQVPSGKYNFTNVSGELGTPYAALFRLTSNFLVGQFYDGAIISVSGDLGWNFSPSFLVSAYYQFNAVRFADRGQEFSAHVARLSLLYMLSTKLSVSTFVQYSNSSKKAIGNFRLRYNPKEGNDLYIVYNDNMNSDRTSEFPILPVSNSRTLLIKYVYTFRL